MPLNITVPEPKNTKPRISVFGVGGAGGNALNNMISSNLEGVEFIAANTDAQSLENSLAKHKIQLGINTTKGLGAGSFPDQGKLAAEENINEINRYLEGNNMVFITAGMGGGTGTGAAPVIAKLSKEKGILTVGVVTKPFDFEGKYRMDIALRGIEELRKYVDTLIIIPNQNLFRIANETTTFESAFQMADNVLHSGVRGITDLITMPGLVNLDFADIKTIMTKMGKAMMGTGEAEGENRAINACYEAISNPLLDDVSIAGAKGVLVNMTGGSDMTLFEADQAVNEIRKQVDANANIIFGSAFNENMRGKIRVSVVATGIGDNFATEDADEIEKNEISARKEIKESDDTFFNPTQIQNVDDEELKEIDSKNFKPKIDLDNFIHEDREVNTNFGDTKVTMPKAETPKVEMTKNLDKIFDHIDSDHFDKIEEDEEEETNFYQKTLEKENYKKEEKKGFSLFKFMKKNKKLQDHEEEEENYDRNDSRQEVLDFSFHDDEIKNLEPEEDNENTKHHESEDGVLDIPTFLRKKK